MAGPTLARSRACSLVLTLALGFFVAGCAGGRSLAGDCCAPATAVCSDVVTPEPADCPPSEAQCGEAWCRVWVPPDNRTICETICVKPETIRCETVPALYGTRPKLICRAPANIQHTTTPAIWGSKSRPVMTCPPGERWRRVECSPEDLGRGEVQCECWAKECVPAQWGQEDCPICISPERRCWQYTPAQYEMGEERYLIRPERVQRFRVPAQFTTRTRDVCVSPGHWEWRRNTNCEVPAAEPVIVEALPGLQLEMSDAAATGENAGVFGVGDTVRYDLVVLNDGGATALEGLTIVFSLPPELEFVSGGGDGVVVTGSGQGAESATFGLPVGGRIQVQLLAKVNGVSPTNLVQVQATVLDSDGSPLAEESESTTVNR